jgi:hypothetical protein
MGGKAELRVASYAWSEVQLASGLAMFIGLELSLIGFALGIIIVAGPMRDLRRRVILMEQKLANGARLGSR